MLAPIEFEDKIRENRLGRLEHISRSPLDAVVRKSDMIIGNDSTRRNGRPKLTLNAVVKNDTIDLNLNEHLTCDRT